MFAAYLESLVTMTDSELDDAIRANELEVRRLAAERAALVAVAEHRGVHQAGTHRSMTGYLRATCNTSTNTVGRDRKLADLVDAHPVVGEALMAGHITVDHALKLCDFHRNPRVSDFLPLVVDALVEQAEHHSFNEFSADVAALICQLDQDGAFTDIASAVQHRNATVADVDGALHIGAFGGDPIQAAQLVAVYDSFVEGEYRKDVDERRAEFGDDAELHSLPRTPAQRRFDALAAVFTAASEATGSGSLPEPTVHIVVDHKSAHEAFTQGDLTLPNGDVLDIEAAAADPTMVNLLAEELVNDPAAFRNRRCHTSNGTAIPAPLALKAAFTGHIRRVVTDAHNVVIEFGAKQRLLTGPARAAAMLLNPTCVHPGCELPAKYCQVDHIEAWSASGPTSQRNSAVECGKHNRAKHRSQRRLKRDQRGRIYTLEPDGTIHLPVGERPPSFLADDLVTALTNRFPSRTILAAAS